MSSCLLVWCLSSLLITNMMIRGGKSTTDDPEEINEAVKRSRQIVRGRYDFRGELIEMPDIDGDGVNNFDSSPT